MKTIEKKILPQYFQAVREEKKNFELRKDEDDVQPGDVLILMEWENGEYTGRTEVRRIRYVLRDVPEYGLMQGYCIMWSHDEQKEINDSYAVMARITCKYCGAVVHKYVESHYTGGSKCVILAKYCRFCGNALRI